MSVGERWVSTIIITIPPAIYNKMYSDSNFDMWFNLQKLLIIHTREAVEDTDRILKEEVPEEHKVCCPFLYLTEAMV